MDPKKALDTLRQQMHSHGIDWDCGLDRAIRRYGYCDPFKRVITLSEPLTKICSEKQVMETILHEIAHALDWKRNRKMSHGKTWKAICIEIGAAPNRCADPDTPNINQPTVVGTCPTCGRETQQYRRRDCSCGKCDPRYNPQHKLVWRKL